jgi:hypothetical protein
MHGRRRDGSQRDNAAAWRPRTAGRIEAMNVFIEMGWLDFSAQCADGDR